MSGGMSDPPGSNPSMCTTPCTGDSTQTCGGSGNWRDVYMLGEKNCVTPGKNDYIIPYPMEFHSDEVFSDHKMTPYVKMDDATLAGLILAPY